jgi:2-polyprenyl-3-methyl-5-hydroxy-6-metoxy-1,4-benzoquinol methylase
MINLSKRSYTKELMDGDNIPFAAMAQTLKELNVINTWLGGHAITLQGVRRFTKGREPITICEIGCGGGDNLFAIHKFCSKKGIPAKFIGIDLNKECIDFAKQQYPQLPCEWICSDYAKAQLTNKPDVVFSSLFCHHFTDQELAYMMKWLQDNSGAGFFVNDLHRHWLAYFLIRHITRFFSRSYLVKNDACLSVARSFKQKEWKTLLEHSGFRDYEVNWKWAFRYLVVVKK